MALFRHFNAALEEHFLVVYWEQRGAGRSYHSDVERGSMTIQQMERIAEQYFETIDAPVKTLVWFEDSAHNPPFEEPDAFVRSMIDVVLPLLVDTTGAGADRVTDEHPPILFPTPPRSP